jgi:nucleoid-associated protein YgaU
MPEESNKRWDDSLISLGLGALVVVVSGILIFNYFSQKGPELVKQQGKLPVSTSPVGSPMAFASSVSVTQNISTPQPSAVPSVTPQATAKTTSTPTATAKPTATPTNAPTATPKGGTIATAAPTQTAISSAQARASATPTPTAAPTNQNTVAQHTVIRGETLWSVSEKYYQSGFEWKKIASANSISNARSLEVGTVLQIPRNEMISATATEKPQTAQSGSSATSSAQITQNTPTQATPAVGGAQSGMITYTVVHGDTLWKVASEKCNDGYLWSSISKQNKLVTPGIIHAGNVLTFTCTR